MCVLVHNFLRKLWIKEVEMVESVDDLKSSRSIIGIHGPNFEVLDARIASALNRIIQNTRFKKKVSLEKMKAQKEDRFFRGRQIAYLIYDHFRVTGANDSVENYANLFSIFLRNDDIQEFDSKWDGILSSMTKIPPDDILEGLYKLRIRESEKLKMPDFEVIHNSHSKRRFSLEEQKAQKQDRFLRGRQIAYLIYDHFRVTGSHDSVENYTDLSTIDLRNDDIQGFDSKWDEILLSMTQTPSNEILESLYKLRIRESEKLKTVLELYNVEIHQKILRPDYQKLKTMVKRSIEQDLRIKNFETSNGNYETSAVVKNQRVKQREQREIGCSNGENYSFRHEQNRHSRILLRDLLRSRV